MADYLKDSLVKTCYPNFCLQNTKTRNLLSFELNPLAMVITHACLYKLYLIIKHTKRFRHLLHYLYATFWGALPPVELSHELS